jgi:4-diphosphocytidyl-2-C-methyl-D-erythritol kinase
MDLLKVKSPAKINIGLNILKKRDDGFHNLETIFYPLKIYDELTYKVSDQFLFQSNDIILANDNSNLIIKAKENLEKLTGKKLNLEIYLRKNIPIGAGLGGGSSNAALTLIAIDQLFNLNIESSTLSSIALQLGSDVPYFLNPVPSFAESRGEKLFPINFKIDKPILIINPGIHISTKWAFSLVAPVSNKRRLKNLIEKEQISIDDLRQIAVNDFEVPVFSEYPQIKKIKELMTEWGALISMMTGTGSTVFGIFDNKKAAEEAAYKFPEHYIKFISY